MHVIFILLIVMGMQYIIVSLLVTSYLLTCRLGSCICLHLVHKVLDVCSLLQTLCKFLVMLSSLSDISASDVSSWVGFFLSFFFYLFP